MDWHSQGLNEKREKCKNFVKTNQLLFALVNTVFCYANNHLQTTQPPVNVQPAMVNHDTIQFKKEALSSVYRVKGIA